MKEEQKLDRHNEWQYDQPYAPQTEQTEGGSHPHPGRCTDRQGCLPSCAPLANPYVPFQPEDAAQYTARQAIVRGTLYPGLDLPFMGMVNKQELSDTPMHQLQALHFAINELALYLDTHPEDQEALELLRDYNEMYQVCKQEVSEDYGPQTIFEAGDCGSYDWVSSPWPWQLSANEEG